MPSAQNMLSHLNSEDKRQFTLYLQRKLCAIQDDTLSFLTSNPLSMSTLPPYTLPHLSVFLEHVSDFISFFISYHQSPNYEELCTRIPSLLSWVEDHPLHEPLPFLATHTADIKHACIYYDILSA